MAKYKMLRDGIGSALPQVSLREAPAATQGQLALVHTPSYIDAVLSGSITSAALREIGFPWSEVMAERACRSVGATVAAVHAAITTGLGANLAGGTHHAYADKGSGFCVFNDVAVAARMAQIEWMKCHYQPLDIAVIDLDVHQGNGTAHIFQNDPTVFTLSVHGDKNFPFRKEASDLDVALADGCDGTEYLAALDLALLTLGNQFDPGLVIYLAGADPFVGDRLGRLSVSADGLEARDRRVFDWCFGRRIPVAFVMAGGYGQQIEETVDIQLTTYRVALSYWQHWRRVLK